MGETFINFKIPHIVTMILKISPAQKAPGLRVGVTGKTLQTTAFHHCSFFTIAPLANARDRGLEGPVITLTFFSQQKNTLKVVC